MILISTQCFPPSIGGIQSIMDGLARAAVAHGIPVTVMADSSTGCRSYDASAGYRIERYSGIKPLRRWMKAQAVDQVVSADKPRVLVCDSWKSAEYLAPRGTPTLVFAFGMEFPPDPSERKKARIAAAMSKASVVVAASRYAASLCKPYVPAATPIAIVNPPIAPLQDATEAAADLRARHGDPVLVALARLEPRKGFDRVIEALPAVAEHHPNVTLLIGGDGSDKARLQALAEQLGVASRVHFLGWVNGQRKAALLSAADLFVMPTRRVDASVEGFGIVYAEAAWFAVPSLAGIEGGAGDFVEPGVTGDLVDGNQPIADALLGLLADRDRLKAMGSNAQAKVRSSGLWEHAFARLMDLAQSAPLRRPLEPFVAA